MPDVIIVGNGPAGISAGNYTARAGLDTLIIGRDQGALAKADRIENYYGFPQPVSGGELVTQGIAQAQRLGARVLSDEVVSVDFDDGLVVRTPTQSYRARAVILATGASRMTPRIPGVAQFEGRGISYCAVCDGYFHRNKDVAVLGEGPYALHEAMELLPLARSVTLLTHGKEPTVAVPDRVAVLRGKIASVTGGDTLERVVFEDGTSLPVSGLFIALGVAGSADLARRLGAETDGTRIVVDENMATSVPGLYAAGDCTGGMAQIAKAVYEGAKAGTAVVQYLRRQSKSSGG